jgi:serine/threonine protein kinase
MTWLSDSAVARLREATDWPDFTGTRYELRDTIGRGGMGVVYRAADRELDREVAIKVVASYLGSDGVPRLRREARILARLEHPGIVPVHDVGTLPDGRMYYVMKLVRGVPLEQAVAGNPPLSERLRLFSRVCEAVGFAHAHGIVHRDLKPGNVMVGAFGEVLVLDWGVARVLPGDSAETDATCMASAEARRDTMPGGVGVPASDAATPPTNTGHGDVLGTPGFMAPEQEQGASNLVDQRADVFALGSMLDWLLNTRGSRVPAPLAAIVTRARERDPASRYGSSEELAAEVSRFLAGLAVRAHPETLPQRVRRLAVRHRTPILLIVAYLLMRILLLIVFRRT